jgi:hypothetical protein
MAANEQIVLQYMVNSLSAVWLILVVSAAEREDGSTGVGRSMSGCLSGNAGPEA